MPMINGQKMACAPCIRGHRSTKCNHFTERVMVPVRKPGRPLSTCPCPPGKPCACGGVKVAIPRKQKCGCGPDIPEETIASPQEQSPPETPTSPTRSSFRVTKPIPSRSNTRKQSFDPANLTRIDPMSVNLVTANGNGVGVEAITMAMVTNGMVSQVPPPVLGGFGTTTGFVPATPGGAFSPPQTLGFGTPLPYDLGLQYSQAPLQRLDIKAEDDAFTPAGLGTPMPPPPYVNGSHHSRSSSINGALQMVELGSPLTTRPPNGTTKATGGSCCGGGAKVSPPPTDFSKPFIPEFPHSMEPKALSLPTPFDFPTIFTYPAHYGSWQHPINPEIWQQVASHPTMSLGAQLPTSPTSGTPAAMGTSHECSCGEGCQCVGCLAHPFNDQMFQYVNNAYIDNNGSVNGSVNGGGGGGGGGSCCGNGTNGVNGDATASPTTQALVTAPESPPEAHTPSDGSALSEERSLSTVDYFFVNIPLRDDGSCGGNLHLCPCGDDCECIGCLVHNAPPVSPEEI